jgi:hypothetical protein
MFLKSHLQDAFHPHKHHLIRRISLSRSFNRIWLETANSFDAITGFILFSSAFSINNTWYLMMRVV